jgi:hypothetical protein
MIENIYTLSSSQSNQFVISSRDQINVWVEQVEKWKSQFNDPNDMHDQVAIDLANKIEGFLVNAGAGGETLNEIMEGIEADFLGKGTNMSMYVVHPGITEEQVTSLYQTLLDGRFGSPPPCTDMEKMYMKAYELSYQLKHEEPPASREDQLVAETICALIEATHEEISLQDLRIVLAGEMGNTYPTNPFLKASPDVLSQFKKIVGI